MKLAGILSSLEIKSLPASPPLVNRLAGDSYLLVAWNTSSRLCDGIDNNSRYDLALYYPRHGWYICRWPETLGYPLKVIPSFDNIWVQTSNHSLAYLSVASKPSTTILSTRLVIGNSLLYADKDNAWLASDLGIGQLRFADDGFMADVWMLSRKASSMYPITGGGWVILEDDGRYSVYSPLYNAKIFVDRRDRIVAFPPYLIDWRGKHLYYTNNPMQGWNKTRIEMKDEKDEIVFFAHENDFYYAAIWRKNSETTVLYRFEDTPEADIQPLWEIPIKPHRRQLVFYNKLLCIAHHKPLTVLERKDVAENEGFLVWDPILDVFYSDVPKMPAINSGHVVSSTLRLPTEWLGNTSEQETRNL